MSWDRLKAEIHKISDTLKNHNINFQEFTEHPKHLLSLSSQLSPLNACGKKNNFSIEAPTSGESSPCLSESGKTPRYFAPSVSDLTQLINQETFTELDYNIEKHNDSSEKDLIMLILIEDLDASMTIEAFYNLLSEVKVNNYNHSDIFESKSPKFIKFKEKRCLSFKVKLKWPKLFARFIRKLQMHIKNSTGHAVKIGEAKLQPPTQNKFLNGVVLRNLPPKLTGEELLHQINQNIQGEVSVGSVKKVKEANCCVVECSYLEDAEVICKKMNKTNWQNPESTQSHIIKAHIYPNNTLKHKQREKSLFSDMFTFKPILKQKPVPKPKPNNLKKTEIRRLIDIFASSEKSTQESTQQQQQTVFGSQSFLFHHHNFENREQEKFQSIKSFVYNLT